MNNEWRKHLHKFNTNVYNGGVWPWGRWRRGTLEIALRRGDNLTIELVRIVRAISLPVTPMYSFLHLRLSFYWQTCFQLAHSPHFYMKPDLLSSLGGWAVERTYQALSKVDLQNTRHGYQEGSHWCHYKWQSPLTAWLRLSAILFHCSPTQSCCESNPASDNACFSCLK